MINRVKFFLASRFKTVRQSSGLAGLPRHALPTSQVVHSILLYIEMRCVFVEQETILFDIIIQKAVLYIRYLNAMLVKLFVTVSLSPSSFYLRRSLLIVVEFDLLSR